MPRPFSVVRLLSRAALFAAAGSVGASELRDAVERVREETGGYILSAQSLRTHGGTVHRVKVLTRDGRVEVRQIAAGVRGGPLGFTAEPAASAGSARDDASQGQERWPDERGFGGDDGLRAGERFGSDRAGWTDDVRYEPRGRVEAGPRSAVPSREIDPGRGARGFERRGIDAPMREPGPPDRPPEHP
jgi:hypothetical protein